MFGVKKIILAAAAVCGVGSVDAATRSRRQPQRNQTSSGGGFFSFNWLFCNCATETVAAPRRKSIGQRGGSSADGLAKIESGDSNGSVTVNPKSKPIMTAPPVEPKTKSSPPISEAGEPTLAKKRSGLALLLENAPVNSQPSPGCPSKINARSNSSDEDRHLTISDLFKTPAFHHEFRVEDRVKIVSGEFKGWAGQVVKIMHNSFDNSMEETYVIHIRYTHISKAGKSKKGEELRYREVKLNYDDIEIVLDPLHHPLHFALLSNPQEALRLVQLNDRDEDVHQVADDGLTPLQYVYAMVNSPKPAPSEITPSEITAVFNKLMCSDKLSEEFKQTLLHTEYPNPKYALGILRMVVEKHASSEYQTEFTAVLNHVDVSTGFNPLHHCIRKAGSDSPRRNHYARIVEFLVEHAIFFQVNVATLTNHRQWDKQKTALQFVETNNNDRIKKMQPEFRQLFLCKKIKRVASPPRSPSVAIPRCNQRRQRGRGRSWRGRGGGRRGRRYQPGRKKPVQASGRCADAGSK